MKFSNVTLVAVAGLMLATSYSGLALGSESDGAVLTKIHTELSSRGIPNTEETLTKEKGPEKVICISPVDEASDLNRFAKKLAEETGGRRLCYGGAWSGSAYYSDEVKAIVASANFLGIALSENQPLVTHTLFHEREHALDAYRLEKRVPSLFNGLLASTKKPLADELPFIYRDRFTMSEIPAYLTGVNFLWSELALTTQGRDRRRSIIVGIVKELELLDKFVGASSRISKEALARVKNDLGSGDVDSGEFFCAARRLADGLSDVCFGKADSGCLCISTGSTLVRGTLDALASDANSESLNVVPFIKWAEVELDQSVVFAEQVGAVLSRLSDAMNQLYQAPFDEDLIKTINTQFNELRRRVEATRNRVL